MTRRARIVVGLLLMVVLGAGCVALPGVRWRLAVLQMKLNGDVDEFAWGELVWDLRPHSPIYLGNLPVVRNPDVAIENPYASAADSGAGADAFRRQCASCHGLEGRGGGHGPSLVASTTLHGKSDWAVFRTISRGVPGTAMQGHALPSRTIWQLVEYVHTLGGVARGALGGLPVSVPFSKLLSAAADPAGWYTYSGDYQSHRFSHLDLINTHNVQRLQMAWEYQSSAQETVVESSPIVVNGVMYATEPPSGVVALNAANGTLQWRFVRLVPDGVTLCCGPVNRGVAILDSLLYLGTLDAHLLALSARSGRVVWDRQVADWSAGYSITGAPLALKDLIISGVGGGENGIRGFIAAYEATTGQRRWQLWTVPSPGERGAETWSGESWKTGGAPTWLTGSYDPALNLLYWGVGNPSPNFNGQERQGDNLYSNSVIALDPDSGRMRWFYQFTPHDEHDWDAAQIPVLIDTDRGNRRHLLGWANRNGFYYLFDRETGQFLLARPFARQTWAAGIDSAGRAQVLASARPSAAGTLVYPSAAGATNWWSPSYSPRTGLFYIPVLDASSIIFSEPGRYTRGEAFLGSVEQPSAQAQTAVRAIDPLTGVMRWEHRFEPRSEWHRVGGILSVAGDVVFIGDDAVFYALDARTGAELWRFNAGGRIVAAPITYMANGKQYVAIAAGRSFMAFGIGAAAPRAGPPSR